MARLRPFPLLLPLLGAAAVACGAPAAAQPADCFDYTVAGWPPTAELLVPGGATDTAATGDGHLLVAGPQGLVVVDVATPASPTIVAYHPVAAGLLEVATDGATVAALADDARLLTGVLTAPGELAWSGELALSFASRLAVDDGLLVFRQGLGQLATVDVSDPKDPRYLGWTATPEAFNDVAVAAGLAFVASELNLLLVYSLADPAAPELIAAPGRLASGLAVALDLPRVHVSNVTKVVTYDASIPTELVLLGESTRLPGFSDLLAAARGRVFAASVQGHVFRLDAPVDAGPEALGMTLLGDDPVALAVVGDHLAAMLPDGRLRVLDPLAGTHPEVGRETSPALPTLVAASDDVLYALEPAHPDGPRLTTAALAPDGPQLGALPLFGTPRALDVDGARLAFATSLTSLALVDVADPAAPVYVSQRGADVQTDDVAVLDRSLCALGRDDFGAETLVLYDQGGDGSLRLASALRMPYGSVQVVGWRDHALVRGRFEMNGLLTVDATDPRAPRIVDWIALPGNSVDLVAHRRHAYVLDDEERVHVVDLSDPSRLVLVRSLAVGGNTNQGNMTVVGDRLLLVEPDRGLVVVDVGAPGAPEVAGAAWVPITGRIVGGTSHLLLNDPLFKERSWLPAVCGGLSAPGGPPPAPGVALSAAPNPFNPRTRLRFELIADASCDLDVYDLAGRRVRRLLAGVDLSAGPHDAVWDGRDDRGRRVGSAVYLARLRAGGRTGHVKLVLVR